MVLRLNTKKSKSF